MSKSRVGIIGGAGYTGGELIRLLLGHPGLELAEVASSTYPGRPLWTAHPNLRRATDLAFSAEIDPAGLDALFLAGGHGEAMEQLPALLKKAGKTLKIVDLSGDFRLRDARLYPTWYEREHASPDLLPKFVYGLTELNRAAVAQARFVANPGCFATAMALALGPLAKAGLAGTARISAVTGSSGSGVKPGAGTHHPTRAATLRAYKPLRHQHVPEVEQLMDQLAGKASLRLALVPVSGPIVRGIYAVCHVDLPAGWTEANVTELFRAAYEGCPFVRLLDAPPDLQAVTGSNFCDLYCAVDGPRLAVIGALDNLVKGASGQAIQNLNLMLGLPETAGLLAPGAYP